MLTEKEISDIVAGLDIEVGKTTHVVVGNRIMFIKAAYDESRENPLTDWDSNGMLYSLSTRHANSISADTFKALRDSWGDDAVVLSYYEHGRCVWFPVGGVAPAGVEFQWDGVLVAGVWVPEGCVEEELKGLTGQERRTRAVELAKQACEVYTDYVNGDVYGYDVKLYELREETEDGENFYYDEPSDYRFKTPIAEDSCWGFYGDESFEETVKSVVKEMLETETANLGGPPPATEHI